MKVLLCGGIRTASIAKELKPRFRTGGVEFILEQDISNIGSLFTRGEYFDRAIIFEQGWTSNGTDTNEFSIRQKISNFIAILSGRDSRDATCVFVATNRDVAQMVSEESIEILNQCIVLVKEPPYTFTFCADLVTTNIDQFSGSIVYRIDEQEDSSDEEEEEIIWSQDHGPEIEDTGCTLGTVPEVSFDKITVEEDTEVELDDATNDGISITDFDSDIFGDDDEADTTDFDKLDDDFDSNKMDIADGLLEFDEDPLDIEEPAEDETLEIEDEPLEIEDEPLEIEEETLEEEPLEIEDEPLEIEDEQIGVEEEPLEIEDEPLEIEDEPLEIEDEPLEIEDEQDALGSLFGDNDKFSAEGIESDEEEQENNDKEDEDVLTIDDTINIEEEQDTLDSLFGSDDDTNIEEEELDEEPENTEIDLDIFCTDGSDTLKDEDDTEVPQQFSKDMYKQKDKPIRETIETPVEKKSKVLFGKKKDKVVRKPKAQNKSSNAELSTVINMLNTFKNRGSSLVVTGTPCSGTSTLVYNLANTIVNLGYTVLIVDMDTVNRTQAFMSKEAYEAVHSLDPENASLKQALNAVNNGIGKYINIIKPGFHILTMGLAGDIVTGEKLAPKQKLARFSSNVRNNYNFIIYDIPFNNAVDYAADITFTADNIVLACEASNHGVMAMMLAMCNIESEDMQEALFGRAQLCMTKYSGIKRILDSNVSNVRDILNRIDKEVQSLLGIDPEYYFSNLGVCGIMNYDTRYEDGWFSKEAYSDLPDGRDEYIKLLTSILLKR